MEYQEKRFEKGKKAMEMKKKLKFSPTNEGTLDFVK
jgi:hypothetical protein